MYNSLVAKNGEKPVYKTLPYIKDQEREPKFRKAGAIFDNDYYYGALLELLGGGPSNSLLDPTLQKVLATQKSQMDAGISGTFVPVGKYG